MGSKTSFFNESLHKLRKEMNKDMENLIREINVRATEVTVSG